jgi:hypothetical protein
VLHPEGSCSLREKESEPREAAKEVRLRHARGYGSSAPQPAKMACAPLPEGYPAESLLGLLSARPRPASTEPCAGILIPTPTTRQTQFLVNSGMSVGQGKDVGGARELEQTLYLPTARYHEEVASMLRA